MTGTRSPKRHLASLAALAGALVVTSTACGSGSGSSAASPTTTTTVAPVIDPGDGGHYSPTILPADFVDAVDNPYFPLALGSRWVYEGEADTPGKTEHTVVVVLPDRKEIMGVSTTTVRDTVRVDGEVIEDTLDWYAQDTDGNVWYFGEAVKNYENGKVVDTDGSFEAGVDGALPGIVMKAHPAVGDAYRQEFHAGAAEDLGRVERVDAAKAVPAGRYTKVVVTTDWNPLEPDVVEQKAYAPGVGVIFEEHVKGGTGTISLLSFEPGG